MVLSLYVLFRYLITVSFNIRQELGIFPSRFKKDSEKDQSYDPYPLLQQKQLIMRRRLLVPLLDRFGVVEFAEQSRIQENISPLTITVVGRMSALCAISLEFDSRPQTIDIVLDYMVLWSSTTQTVPGLS